MTSAAPGTAAAFSPWRAVVGFGVVSLTADMVYEGARSVTGPLLASLVLGVRWSGAPRSASRTPR